jgi:hypothetical protein
VDPANRGVTRQLGLIVFQEVQRTAGGRPGILAEPLTGARCRDMVAEQIGVEFDPAGERWGVEEISDGGQAAGVVVQGVSASVRSGRPEVLPMFGLVILMHCPRAWTASSR